MSRFNLFIIRPCGGDDRDQLWQITHQQSGDHTLAASPTAATTWLARQVEETTQYPARSAEHPLPTEAP
jgi:hypothetical protein